MAAEPDFYIELPTGSSSQPKMPDDSTAVVSCKLLVDAAAGVMICVLVFFCQHIVDALSIDPALVDLGLVARLQSIAASPGHSSGSMDAHLAHERSS